MPPSNSPSLPPPPPPPQFRDQRNVDTDHLRALSICHYVAAGLSVLGLCFIAMHYTIVSTVLNNPGLWKNARAGAHNPPPDVFAHFFAVFKWLYLLGIVVLVAYGILNILSARFIKARRHKTFSLVVAALNCLHIPLGTLLGAFTACCDRSYKVRNFVIFH